MQLPLDLAAVRGHALDDFYPGPNQEAVALVRRALADRGRLSMFLHGQRGAGKTHLLQALCRAAGVDGLASAYLPMRLAGEQFGPRALDGLQSLPIVCVDDLDAVAGDRVWEHAVAQLMSAAAESGTALAVGSGRELNGLGCVDSGLEFRLSLSSQVRLEVLEADDKVWALQLHARTRGIRLPERVARYLLRHYSADLSVLSGILAGLDYASMAAKRKLTIPFVRSVLRPES